MRSSAQVPGDPGLITMKGLELLRACDAVVYDRLVAEELVDEAPEDALRICRDGLDQDAVDGLLVELGRELDVVRLKGGDPFVFGRGGEEALVLVEAGVDVEVVPGVSSIAAVPAAAGIPVTHRGVADRVTIATAHAADGSEPDYEGLARVAGRSCSSWASRRLDELARGLDRGGAARLDAGGRRLARHAAGPDDGHRTARRACQSAQRGFPDRRSSWSATSSPSRSSSRLRRPSSGRADALSGGSRRIPGMRTQVSPSGPLGHPRGIGFAILIFIVTLGLYSLYWVFKTQDEVKEHSGIGVGGVVGLVIYIVISPVTWFLVPSEVGKLYTANGRAAPFTGWTGLWMLLPIVGAIVWFVKIQGALNRYWASKAASTPLPA